MISPSDTLCLVNCMRDLHAYLDLAALARSAYKFNAGSGSVFYIDLKI